MAWRLQFFKLLFGGHLSRTGIKEAGQADGAALGASFRQESKMKIEIVTNHVENEEMVREFIQRKVKFALESVKNRVAHLTVRLEDEADHVKSLDFLCQIEASMLPEGEIHVSAHGESFFDSALQACRKMQHAILYGAGRNSTSSRIGHRAPKQALKLSLEDKLEPENDKAGLDQG